MPFASHRVVSDTRLRASRSLAPLLVALALSPSIAGAQTDYYNTDAGRPLAVEDALPLELRALELQLAPVRFTRFRGATELGFEPELALGILPRTQVEVGIPITVATSSSADAHGSSAVGLTVAALHALNVETSLPAFAVGGSIAVLGGESRIAQASVKAIATRTMPGVRVHVNAAFSVRTSTNGSDEEEVTFGDELSRWLAGVAIDRTFPLSSLLIGAELTAREPLGADRGTQWSTAAGARYQLGPRSSLDGGVGVHLTGPERGWFVTAGAAVQLYRAWRPDR